MKLSRRRLFSLSGQSLLGFGLAHLFGARALAGVNPSRRFVFAYFEGGWDLLLGLDPRDPATTNARENRIDPAYDLLPPAYRSRGISERAGLRFGPAVPEALLAHASKLTIVNGIGMDTAAHEVGRRYFITGRFPRGLAAVGSSVPAEIAAAQGDHSAIPHLAAGVEAYAGGLPSFAAPFRMNGISDLAVALTPFVALPDGVLAAVEAFHAAGPGCASTALDATGVVREVEANRARAANFIDQDLGGLFDLSRTDAEMAGLRERYGINEATPLDGPEALAFVAGQAVKHGVSQCVSVRVARGLDTHSGWAADHPPALERGFSALAALISDLEQAPLPEDPTRSVLDETTIVAFSEFGRTPTLNALNGRDHHLGNSCLLAGAGIRPGLTFGASASVGMLPVPVEPVTGRIVERPTSEQEASGQVVTLSPAHVLTTVFRAAGLSGDVLRSTPIPALLD